MKLLLFHTPSGNVYPVIEMLPGDSLPSVSGSGRWARIKESVRRAYENLRKRLDYQERLCSQMRHTIELEVYHPSNLNTAEARDKLLEFLRQRHRKHSRWLLIDALLAVLGIFLMPVPGPNVFFFYPAARTLGHYLAREGAKRVLSLDTLSFHSDSLMDRVQSNQACLESVRDALEQLERRYNMERLEPLLTSLGDR